MLLLLSFPLVIQLLLFIPANEGIHGLLFPLVIPANAGTQCFCLTLKNVSRGARVTFFACAKKRSTTAEWLVK